MGVKCKSHLSELQMCLGYEAVNLFTDNLMTTFGINNSLTC